MKYTNFFKQQLILLQNSPTCFSLQAILKEICTNLFYRRYLKFSSYRGKYLLPGLIKMCKMYILA